jgi:hypothetical protein
MGSPKAFQFRKQELEREQQQGRNGDGQEQDNITNTSDDPSSTRIPTMMLYNPIRTRVIHKRVK